MSTSSLRTGLVRGGAAGAAVALISTVALFASNGASAQVAEPVYGSAPPSASPATPASPAPSASPATPAEPSPQAEAKSDEMVAELPAGTTEETKAVISTALDNAAASFAASGLTAEQQVAALEALSSIVSAMATQSGATEAQVLAAINTASSIVPSLLSLPATTQQAILAGMTTGLAASSATLAAPGTQQAVVETVTQAVSVLTASGQIGLLSESIVSQLVQVTALAIDGKTDAGSTGGVVPTATTLADGGVQFVFSGLQPGSTAIVVLNVADATVAGALRAALGDGVIAYNVDSSGRATLVLTGTANELGKLVVAVPGSALGSTTAAQAQAALNRTTLGVVGTTTSGSTAVFAGPVVPAKPATPSITARRTPVVPHRGAAVLTGTAQPGTKVTLYGRTAGAPYRFLRSTVVDGSGAYSFTVYPHASMRFYVQSALNGQSVDSASTVVSVRAAVSQAVNRVGAKTYRFSGRVSPAQRGTLVQVFYAAPGGGSVLAATARTTSDGTWSLTRRFTGAGTFSFFTRTATNNVTVGGISPVQRITIN